MDHCAGHGNCLFGQKYGSPGNGIPMYVGRHVAYSCKCYYEMGYMHKSVQVWTCSKQVFHVPSSWHWQSHSELEVCKLEQPLCIKIGILCSRNLWECNAELHAARWVQEFSGGRVATTDIHRNGCLSGDVDGMYHFPHRQQCTVNNPGDRF